MKKKNLANEMKSMVHSFNNIIVLSFTNGKGLLIKRKKRKKEKPQKKKKKNMAKPVLTLYRQLLHLGAKHPSYNIRKYVDRRVKYAFHQNMNETDPTKINGLIKEAEENIAMLKRQVAISSMWGKEELVVENFYKH